MTQTRLQNIKSIALIRAGFMSRHKNAHPLHCAAPISLKCTQAFLLETGVARVSILDCMIKMKTMIEIEEAIKTEQVDLVVLDVASATYEHGIALCDIIKKNPLAIIIGVGSDVSERAPYYQMLDKYFDVLIRGEYEQEVCSFVRNYNKGQTLTALRNFYNQIKIKDTHKLEDLRTLPVLKWSLDELLQYPYRYPLNLYQRIIAGYVFTSRGCAHACSFCSPSVRKTFGNRLRLQRAEHVVNEMDQLKKIGVNFVSFEDDDFTGSQAHVKAICAELIRGDIQISWCCHARIDEVDLELLLLMRQSGCVFILFGVESGSKSIVEKLNKSPQGLDWNEQARRTFLNARQAGIATCALFIVGSPEETMDDVNSSIRLALRLKPDIIKVHNFTLYPGSRDYRKYQKKSSSFSSQHHYLQPLFNVSAMSDHELRRAQIIFYRRIFFRPGYIVRHLWDYLIFYILNWDWSFNMLNEVLMFLLFSNKKKYHEKL
ncbi:MAG: B12-binding domain-containing radical SAM protein [Candidatus Omnitrophica bacterium]|nr:B12-binding domain-containing radical SAM protein [Candidatus Omnitrophota bacterium]